MLFTRGEFFPLTSRHLFSFLLLLRTPFLNYPTNTSRQKGIDTLPLELGRPQQTQKKLSNMPSQVTNGASNISNNTKLKISKGPMATTPLATVPYSMEATPLNMPPSTSSSTTFHTTAISASDLPTPVKTEGIALTGFTLYPKLPLELRFRIIHFAVKHFPRILQVIKYVELDY